MDARDQPDAHARGRATKALIGRRVLGYLAQPPRMLEVVLWALVVGAVIGVRLYLLSLLPTYLWSGDTASYANPAFGWLDTGEMVFDSRRGPVYSLVIAAVARVTSTLTGVVWAQHALGAVGILATLVAGRAYWGRSAAIPLAAFGFGYALYGMPIHLEHLLRNETLLFAFSSLAIASWLVALKNGSAWFLFLAALCAGLLSLTKNVFLPFPLAMAAGALAVDPTVWRTRAFRLALIAAGFLLPSLLYTVHRATAANVEPARPQVGLLLFGRTAQWTVLDGGIEPEAKAVIRADIEDYRRLPKLDNNLVLKRTAVPHLSAFLSAEGKTPSDLERLCRRLAFEAIRAHPEAFARQVLGDVHSIHFKAGVENSAPHRDDLRLAIEDMGELDTSHRVMDRDATIATLDRISEGRRTFYALHRLERLAWPFQLYPPLLTTLALVLLVGLTRGTTRLFFAGIAAVWFFNVVLLSTVGRPLERYLMPVVPAMFWAQAGAVVLAWKHVVRR